MKAEVFSVASIEKIETELQSVLQKVLEPTLAIVFSSIVHNLEELSTVFALTLHKSCNFYYSLCGFLYNIEKMRQILSNSIISTHGKREFSFWSYETTGSLNDTMPEGIQFFKCPSGGAFWK